MSKSPSLIELMRNVERKKLYISIKLFLTRGMLGVYHAILKKVGI